MSQYWNPLVTKLEPYVPGEQPKDQRYIKLNTNENPYPPSPQALAAIQAEADAALRLYPDPEGLVLKEALAAVHAIDTQQIFVGNGSDEVLAHIFHALFQTDKPVVFPDISYSFYPVYARLYELQTQTVALRDDFSLNVSDFPANNGGIIFPNPNAPTGCALGLSAIEQLLQQHTDSVLVVDEAYVAFGADSAIPLVQHYPNLLVVQTLSKAYSLAGLRVGFAVGQAHLISALERVKNSFNSFPLGRMALAGAAAAIRDQAYWEQTRQQVMATRQQTVMVLEQLDFTVLPSTANFVLARPPDGNAEGLYQALKQRGILVRYFNKPRIQDYVRISIGTDEEMAAFLAALQQLAEVEAW